MPQTSEPRIPPAQQNIQDAFLNHARRERCVVRIQFVDGHEIEGRIQQFDRFSLIVDCGGADQMIFKHAIRSIALPRGTQGHGTAGER